MEGMAVTQQSPIPLRRRNQVQTTRDGDAAEEVVPEMVATKDVADKADKADASTYQNTHNQPGTSREKWRILAPF